MTWLKSAQEVLLNDVIKSNSLNNVIAHIRSIINKEVTITDHLGRIHSSNDGLSSVEDIYLSIPKVDWQKQKYYFDCESKNFYYYIGGDTAEAYVAISDVEDREISQILVVLEDSALAVRMYFNRLNAILSTKKKYKDELLRDLMFENVYSLKEIIKRTNFQELDFARVYYVTIFIPEQKYDMNILYSYTKDWLKFNNLDIVCSIWLESSLVFLCPSHFHDQTFEIDYGWDRHLKNITRYKKEINKRFNITSIMGIGQKYPLLNAKKSYQEAKMAMVIGRLMGHTNFIKHYKDLGIYRLLYDHEQDTLKAFIESTLAPLIEYDKHHDGELTTTLRCLFNSNMNWKMAAKNLFIHVNTLRYRIHKINQLLKVDLNEFETQMNLCLALRIMDSLEDLNLQHIFPYKEIKYS